MRAYSNITYDDRALFLCHKPPDDPSEKAWDLSSLARPSDWKEETKGPQVSGERHGCITKTSILKKDACRVDQPGLEICRALRDPLTERKKPGTSRLWVSQSDIPWDFVICNHSWLSVLYKIIIFFESQKIPLTEIVCLRIVYAELLERSAFVNSSAKLLSLTFITLSSSEV